VDAHHLIRCTLCNFDERRPAPDGNPNPVCVIGLAEPVSAGPNSQDLSLALIFDAIKHARYDFPSPYWDDVSEEAKDLVAGMLTADPRKRLTCRQCLEHAWVQKFYSDALSKANRAGFQDKLKGFNIARKLKGALLTFSALSRFQNAMSFRPTPKEAMDRLAEVQADATRLAELRESFDLLDRNHLDQITVENVAEFLHRFGNYTSHEEAKKMVDGIDLYHLGHISFDEFCIMMGPRSGKKTVKRGVSTTEAEFNETFNMLDTDNKGVISKEDIMKVLNRIGTETSDHEVDFMLKCVGKEVEHQGTINKNAFVELMRRPSSDWVANDWEASEGFVSDVY
jgi:Ca2+-binding EF-hand superfamily protein